jgi:hypothetical protein
MAPRGPRMCGGGCETTVRDRVFISIPGYPPLCIECGNKNMASVLSRAKSQATRLGDINITLRDVVSCIISKYDQEKAARKNIPTAAGIKKAVDMGVLTTTDLEDMLHLARQAESAGNSGTQA